MATTSSPPLVGDRVAVLWHDVISHCPQAKTFHGSQSVCAALYPHGKVDDVTAANGGPVHGHGNFVTLECPHPCRVALSRAEMRVVA